jgi:Tfp pilus assembly protein PilN
VKAVNLIPSDSRRGGRGTSVGVPRSPAYALIGGLVVVLAFVTIYVLTANTISERKAKVATLEAQGARERAVAAQLTNYASFEQLAQTRATTVREIAAARFDWHGALAQLSKVVPADTSLQSLTGPVAPGATAASSSGAGSSLRSDISVPAIELGGCTKTQDDVARLMSRLRLIDGVTRVTLSNSQKATSAQSGAAVTSGGGGAAGCGSNAPSFDMVVFFSTLANAGPTGVTGVGALPVSTTTPTGATP